MKRPRIIVYVQSIRHSNSWETNLPVSWIGVRVNTGRLSDTYMTTTWSWNQTLFHPPDTRFVTTPYKLVILKQQRMWFMLRDPVSNNCGKQVDYSVVHNYSRLFGLWINTYIYPSQLQIITIAPAPITAFRSCRGSMDNFSTLFSNVVTAFSTYINARIM